MSTESGVSLSPGRSVTIRTGVDRDTCRWTDSGENSLTMSVPVRSADRQAMAGAPKYGPPAMTMSLPFCPLWLDAPGTGYLSMSPGPTRW